MTRLIDAGHLALALALAASTASGREVGNPPLGDGLTETSEQRDELPDAARTIELLLKLPAIADGAAAGNRPAPGVAASSPLPREKPTTADLPKAAAAPSEAASNLPGMAADARAERAAWGSYPAAPAAPRSTLGASEQVVRDHVAVDGLPGRNLADPDAFDDSWAHRALQFARDNALELAIALMVGLALTWLVSALLAYAWRVAPHRRRHRHHSHRSSTALYVPILTPTDRPAEEPHRHRRRRRRHHHHHDPLSASAGPADGRDGDSTDSGARTSRRRRARHRDASSA